MNVLNCFTEFRFDDLNMDEQFFADYKSKYLDLHDKVRSDRQKEKVSILEDIDFELELIHRDEINVSYILRLLENIKTAPPAEQERLRIRLGKMLETEAQLRSKKELIERFISEQFDAIPEDANLREVFDGYWVKEKAIQDLATVENLDEDNLRTVIDRYLFTELEP